MEPVTEQLLRTKLIVPPLRQPRIQRPALREALNRGLQLGCRLTLASAPPGYGKTTLIAEWVQQLGRPIAWLSLEASENDPARFWRYLVAALEIIAPEVGHELPWPAPGDAPERFSDLAGALLNRLVAGAVPSVLVLDDYHVIAADIIHRSLNLLLDQLPQPIHVAIITRWDPPLNLALRRGRLQVQEVRAHHLSLSVEQAGEFLNGVMALDLSAEQVRTLQTKSEGWITGLQLAALSLGNREDRDRFIASFTGNDRHVSEYLVGEMLRHQPDEIAQFLLRTSILERFSAPLCDAVTGRDDSDEMLRRLESANLFLQAVDAERQWFRYHPLFSAPVRAHYLRRAPREIEEGHRRASAWFAAEGYAREAIQHALAGRDYARAALLLDRTMVDLAKQGQVLDFDAWLTQVPSETARSYPRLGLAFAWAAMYRGDLVQVQSRLDRVEKLLQEHPPQDKLDAADCGCQIASLRSWLALFLHLDADTALAYARQAVAGCPGLEPAIQAGAFHCLAQALHGAGDTAGADHAFGETIALAQAGHSIYSEILVSYFWAMYLVEAGQLTLARELCQWLVIRCQREPATADLLLPIYYGLALVCYERNELDEAIAFAKLAASIKTAIEYVVHTLELLTLRIRLAQAGGNLAGVQLPDAPDYISFRSAFAPGPHVLDVLLRLGRVDEARMAARGWGLNRLHPCVVTLSELTAWARVLIANGEPEPALDLLDRLAAIAGHANLKGHLVQIAIQRALAHQARRDNAQAIAALEQALILAQHERFCRSFLDAGPAMAALLQKAAGAHRYAGPLLAAFGADAQVRAAAVAPLPAEPLTGRELEVLRLLARRMSYGEISETLIVSLNTVRTHVRNLYAKLEANSAEMAVERGRQIGLLD